MIVGDYPESTVVVSELPTGTWVSKKCRKSSPLSAG